ncbi:MAG: glycosyltransferase [Holophagaceae bacterium]|nr:glycosyltransferase [Holophagaceae bacterium]
MPLISLAMIVKNEEATLAHCLESVKSLVDEMVIVDTGSTDMTMEIAREYSAKIYNFEWCDDFSVARNESLKHCTGDWILIMDADEAIDALDYEKIRNACQNPTADAYNLISRNYMPSSNSTSQDSGTVPNKSDYSEGKNLPFYADNPCLRLVRAFDGLSYSGKIHESIGPSLVANQKIIVENNAVIHHYGKLFSDREEHKAKYYFMLARLDAEKKPGDRTALFNLLQQALVAKQWEVALNTARTCIKLFAELDPLIFYGAGLALQELGRHAEAILYFDKLVGEVPNHALGIIRKGYSLEILGDVETGRELMKKAIEISPDYVLGYGYLAELEMRANNFDVARKIALEAVNLAPKEPTLYDLLIKIELSRNDYSQAATEAIRGIRRCPYGGGGVWHRVAAMQLFQTGENVAARSMLRLGLQAFPKDPDLIRLKKMMFG